MRRLFVRIAILTAALVVLLVLVRAVGGTAANPLAAMFTETILADGKVQVCWHDICPGQLTMPYARQLLEADPSLEAFGTTGEDPLEQNYCWRNRGQSYGVCLNGTASAVLSLSLHYYDP